MPTTQVKEVPFKIGADPEFLLFHGARAIDANSIMNNFFSRKSGLQQASMGYVVPDAGEIGWDGASSTGELRPLPNESPERVTKNIGALIEALHKNMPFLDYTTLSIGNPIGGHIHLDVPSSLMRSGMSITNAERTVINRITKLLSTFIMPIIASEHRISSNSRMHMGYGKADDIRWGTNNQNQNIITAEVRGMSAEWITSPKIAQATLAYIGVVWHELLTHHAELIKEPAVLKTKGHISAVQQMMLSDYKLIENAITKSVGKMVRQFELYPLFKEEIDFVLSPKDVLLEKEKAGWNLSSGWGIENVQKMPTKKQLFSSKKIAREINDVEQATISDTLQVPYNDDYNVAFFSKEMTDRIAALNWKLNNEYFLFGLKKGIEGFAAMRVKENTFYAMPKNQEKRELYAACVRMGERLNDRRPQMRIDPKTGKTRQAGINQVVVGIPYGLRAENNTKSLIEFIWNIENGKLLPKDQATFQVELVSGKVGNEPDRYIENALTGNGTAMNVSEELLASINDAQASL